MVTLPDVAKPTWRNKNAAPPRPQSGDLESCERVFRRGKELGVQPTIVAYNILIKAAAKQGDLASAEPPLSETPESLDSAPMCLCKQGRCFSVARAASRASASARAVLSHRVQSLPRRGCCPEGCRSAAATPSAHLTPGRAPQERWLQEAKKSGAEPNLVTYTSLITAAAKHGDLATGGALLRSGRFVEETSRTRLLARGSSCGARGPLAVYFRAAGPYPSSFVRLSTLLNAFRCMTTASCLLLQALDRAVAQQSRT